MVSPAKPVVCIVTPGTRGANNGNWRTAARWSEMLRDRYRVIVQSEWRGEPVDLMLALHAKRSASSVAAFRASHPEHALAVVLSGTDIYRDLPDSREAAASLDHAGVIVALQENALERLTPAWRRKAQVIFQSAKPLPRRARRNRVMRCAIVGHLRVEKDPATLFEAVGRIPRELPIEFRHIGAPLDPELARGARALARRDARYRYLGALPHGLARAAIARADLLVHPSRMEGGANVIAEALTGWTPVLASRVSGNVGMLGADYPGYFECGDAHGLAARLVELHGSAALRANLARACAKRRSLFEPRAESRALHDLLARMAGAPRR